LTLFQVAHLQKIYNQSIFQCDLTAKISHMRI